MENKVLPYLNIYSRTEPILIFKIGEWNKEKDKRGMNSGKIVEHICYLIPNLLLKCVSIITLFL